MKILVIDCETTRLPARSNSPIQSFDEWPHIVQLAWIQADETSSILERANHIIKPDNYIIPLQATEIHHITTEMAIAEGVELQGALDELRDIAEQSDIIVGHNVSFDRRVIGAACYRLQRHDFLHGKPRISTMNISAQFVGIPSSHNSGWKNPKLTELYYKLFRDTFNAHNAEADVDATLACFFELIARKVITRQHILNAFDAVKV